MFARGGRTAVSWHAVTALAVVTGLVWQLVLQVQGVNTLVDAGGNLPGVTTRLVRFLTVGPAHRWHAMPAYLFGTVSIAGLARGEPAAMSQLELRAWAVGWDCCATRFGACCVNAGRGDRRLLEEAGHEPCGVHGPAWSPG